MTALFASLLHVAGVATLGTWILPVPSLTTVMN